MFKIVGRQKRKVSALIKVQLSAAEGAYAVSFESTLTEKVDTTLQTIFCSTAVIIIGFEL